MSNLPLDPTYFEGARRISPIDPSEGGAPLASLLNSAGQSSEAVDALTGALDLSAATAAVVKAASRKTSTNIGAARAFTLPDFATAPDGWEHTFIALDGVSNTFTVTHAGSDTINGIAGDIPLVANHGWCKISKAPSATGWAGIGGVMVTPA